MQYNVNNHPLHYHAEGLKATGENDVLLHHDLDLTSITHWATEGFTIEKLFDDSVYKTFIENTGTLLKQLWRKAGLVMDDNFNLDQYHTLVQSKNAHLAAIEFTKLIQIELFPVAISLLEKRISAICGKEIVARNPYDGQSVFHFRIVRPQLPDNNPLHRDVWLEDYKDCINLYIPIAGSNENSSLILIPQSHQWPESKVERTLSGAIIDNVKFNVPAVTNIAGEINCIRPDPKDNEVLVFSPYLIHGGSINLNENMTRISIEIRLWKK